jgi:iron complex transport system substrate-binding protein
MMRIVSLLASGTEIVCALGAGEWLVGRSHECDNPGWVRALPACTRPAFDVDVSSGAIDAEVRRRIATGEPLYHVDTDLIRSLAPGLLITQMHCAVCAVTPDDVARAGGETVAEQVVALSAGSVGGIYDGIRRVAAALDRAVVGEAVIAGMQGRIAAVSAAVRGRPTPTVVVLEWTDPIFATGNWGPELVEAAGGRALLSHKDQYSTAIAWSRVREADPDHLIVAPCGFGLERTLQEVPLFEALPGWFELRAVREGQVAFADGNTYFNRSGTTIVETVEILAGILHGGPLAAPWRGKAWRSYQPGAGVVLAHTPLQV